MEPSPVEPGRAGDKEDRVAEQCQDKAEGSFDMWQKPKASRRLKSATESDRGKSRDQSGGNDQRQTLGLEVKSSRGEILAAKLNREGNLRDESGKEVPATKSSLRPRSRSDRTDVSVVGVNTVEHKATALRYGARAGVQIRQRRGDSLVRIRGWSE